ncbi:hypothetical protein HWV62_30679 [Athelia sp. TMB]|nr:hypothetical protein HWV62_30679 [Athelia sp. TMB]
MLMVSQLVLGVRTWNLSKRSPRVGWFLLGFSLLFCIGEWFTQLYKRSPMSTNGGYECHALGVAPGYGVWIHYLFRVVFTFVLTVMSFVYLAKYYFSRKASMVWDVIEIMFFDGLGYFLLLTAVNVFSMVLYMSESPTQSAGGALNFTITWVMTQRLLIDLNEAGIARREKDTVTVSQTIESALEISRAARSFDSQKDEGGNSAERGEQDSVRVRIEKTVRIDEAQAAPNYDYDFRARRPGTSWAHASKGTTCTLETESEDSLPRPPRDFAMTTLRP